MLNPGHPERNFTTPNLRDTTVIVVGPSRPNVGRATAHLYGLQRHLAAIGHPAEAAAIDTAIDMLIPSRTRRTLRYIP